MDPLEIFESLEANQLLFRQDPKQDTCVAVTYLNLAVYLVGVRPKYTIEDVKTMLDSESNKVGERSWEKNVFPQLANGKMLKSHEFKNYGDWQKELTNLINIKNIPVGISIRVKEYNYHEMIGLKIIGVSTLVVYEPVNGFVDLRIEKRNVINYSTGQEYSHHPKFHIYYPWLD